MKLLVCDDDISTIDVIQSQLNLQELGITTVSYTHLTLPTILRV